LLKLASSSLGAEPPCGFSHFRKAFADRYRMGAGASAASVAVTAASAEDLAATLAGLPEEDRTKVLEALKGAPAADAAAADAAAPAAPAADAAAADAAAADAPAADAAAADAPAADAAAGDAAAKPAEKAAAVSFIAEYFDKAQARTEALMADQAKLIEIITNPESAKKFQDECNAWFEADAKPLLEKSFKEHDTKGTGVLDKEEAAAFFANLIDEDTQLSKAMSASAGATAVRGQLKADNPEASDQQVEDRVKKAIEGRNAEIQKKQDAYTADKAARDAAALKVLDVSGDGTLDLKEFLAAFEPENKKNIELHLALGFLTEEEVAAYNA